MFTQSIKDMCVSNTGGRQAFSQAFACNCTVTQSFHNYNLLFIADPNKLFLCCFYFLRKWDASVSLTPSSLTCMKAISIKG